MTEQVAPVVLRTSWTTYAAYLPVVVLAAGLPLLMPAAGLVRPLTALVAGTWLLSLLVRLPFVLRMRVELRPGSLVVLDRQRWQIASADITDVAVVPTGSLGSAALYVNDVSGARELVAVRAFWPWQRSRLERQRAQISQWWLANRTTPVTQPSA